jgi:hypothetical protein
MSYLQKVTNGVVLTAFLIAGYPSYVASDLNNISYEERFTAFCDVDDKKKYGIDDNKAETVPFSLSCYEAVDPSSWYSFAYHGKLKTNDKPDFCFITLEASSGVGGEPRGTIHFGKGGGNTLIEFEYVIRNPRGSDQVRLVPILFYGIASASVYGPKAAIATCGAGVWIGYTDPRDYREVRHYVAGVKACEINDIYRPYDPCLNLPISDVESFAERVLIPVGWYQGSVTRVDVAISAYSTIELAASTDRDGKQILPIAEGHAFIDPQIYIDPTWEYAHEYELEFSPGIDPTLMGPIPEGDISLDTKVDLDDTRLGLETLTGTRPETFLPIPIHKDVNGDNKIGLEEVLYSMQKAATLR